jgi:hypothetical protein
METKLTLSMNAEVIKKAKDFAKKHHISLSKLAEDYFAVITAKEKTKTKKEVSPLVRQLSGVLQLPANFDLKKDRLKHLQEKHK